MVMGSWPCLVVSTSLLRAIHPQLLLGKRGLEMGGGELGSDTDAQTA